MYCAFQLGAWTMCNRRWSASTRWCTSSASLARLQTRKRWGGAARPPQPPLRPRRRRRRLRLRRATSCASSPCPTPMTTTPGNDGAARPHTDRRTLATPAPPTANLAYGLGHARYVAGQRQPTIRRRGPPILRPGLGPDSRSGVKQ